VSANERKVVDLPLEIGQLAENVTVTADAPLLDTATASIGLVVNARQVEYIPLNGRTPLMLAQLSAGVISLTEPGITRPSTTITRQTFRQRRPTRSNELLMDGTPNATRDSRSAYNPPWIRWLN